MKFLVNFRGSENGDFFASLGVRSFGDEFPGDSMGSKKGDFCTRANWNRTIFQLSWGSFQLGMKFLEDSIRDQNTAIFLIELIENRTIFRLSWVPSSVWR